MKRPKVKYRPITINDEPSLTDQSQAPQTDINNIMKAYMKTGDEALLKRRAGQYADLTQIGDLSEALSQIQLAEEAFMDLPSDLRYRLNNDPSQFIEYLNDPQNTDEAIRLGFLVPRQENADISTTANPPKTRTKKQPDLPLEESEDDSP